MLKTCMQSAHVGAYTMCLGAEDTLDIFSNTQAALDEHESTNKNTCTCGSVSECMKHVDLDVGDNTFIHTYTAYI